MSRFSQPECHRTEPIDPRLDGLLRHVIAIGAVLVLLLPAARGNHTVLGWLPLWLLAMPMVAWWALHRFPLPGWARHHWTETSASTRRSTQTAKSTVRASKNRLRPKLRQAHRRAQ